ncbi:MAG: DUF2637 domain-containing protein [Methanospirillum sp.]|uniref:DUF2637 domain-containing protein n=1 Tax=Methanospirillum sp. TaxID=45200 RepID=UPI002373A9D1|nr:DUF2637 domain-containing protein [Methanospirillum sp.]MDD1729458.1 DUF2637 domain-containing protein [Methanospirillum sp.]
MLVVRMERMIPDVTGGLAILIMVCAFLLSFANLQAGAVEAGISPWLSWAWPVCMDALLIAGSLMILRSSLRQEATRFGWMVVVTFTGVSIGFNIAHSPGDFVSREAHAVPPITLMVSIKMFTMIIRSDLKGERVTSVHVTSPEPEVTQPDVPLPRRKVTDEDVLQYFAGNTDVTYLDVAEELQVTRQKISRNVTRLVEEGRLVREGKRLLVAPDQEKDGCSGF